jgi:hypothetical protein
VRESLFDLFSKIKIMFKTIKSFFIKDIPVLNRTAIQVIVVAAHSCFIGYFMYLTIDIIYSSIYDIYQISIGIDRMIVTILFTIIEFLIALKAKGKSISKIILITLHFFVVYGFSFIMFFLWGLLVPDGLPYEMKFMAQSLICSFVLAFIDCLILLLTSKRKFIRFFRGAYQILFLWLILLYISMFSSIYYIKFTILFTIVAGAMYAWLIKQDSVFKQKRRQIIRANALIIFLYFPVFILYVIVYDLARGMV